jgi:hypothetical protein
MQIEIQIPHRTTGMCNYHRRIQFASKTFTCFFREQKCGASIDLESFFRRYPQNKSSQSELIFLLPESFPEIY